MMLATTANGNLTDVALDTLVMEWAGAIEDEKAHMQPYMCAVYLRSSRARTGAPGCNGVMTDAGWCHALPLQCALGTWPNNNATVAPPMAIQTSPYTQLTLA